MGNYGTIIIIHQNSIEHSGQQSTAKQFITCDLFSSSDDPPCHTVEDTGDGALVSARLGWQLPPAQHALVPSPVLLLLDQEHLIIQISGSLSQLLQFPLWGEIWNLKISTVLRVSGV